MAISEERRAWLTACGAKLEIEYAEAAERKRLEEIRREDELAEAPRKACERLGLRMTRTDDRRYLLGATWSYEGQPHMSAQEVMDLLADDERLRALLTKLVDRRHRHREIPPRVRKLTEAQKAE